MGGLESEGTDDIMDSHGKFMKPHSSAPWSSGPLLPALSLLEHSMLESRGIGTLGNDSFKFGIQKVLKIYSH